MCIYFTYCSPRVTEEEVLQELLPVKETSEKNKSDIQNISAMQSTSAKDGDNARVRVDDLENKVDELGSQLAELQERYTLITTQPRYVSIIRGISFNVGYLSML